MGESRIPGAGGRERSLIGPYVGSHIIFTPPKSLAETILHLLGVGGLRVEEGKVSGLKLFRGHDE